MLKVLRENLALKIIALGVAIMVWMYAGRERTSQPTRQVMAEVQRTGTPAGGITVDLRVDQVPVLVSGPQGELDQIPENGVKAVVDVSAARPGAVSLPVTRFALPTFMPGVQFPVQRRLVPVQVTERQRRRFPIMVEMTARPPHGQAYSPPKIEPSWCDVNGSAEEVRKVDRLVVYAGPTGATFRADLMVRAVDKDNVQIETVRVDPSAVRVEMALMPELGVKSVVVNAPVQGSPATPFALAEVKVDPPTVVVQGSEAVLSSVTSIQAQPISVDGIKSDLVRESILVLPVGVTLKGGRDRVTVTVRVRDTSQASP